MVIGVFSVAATQITGSLSVNQFYVTPPATPGNVGVSLSWRWLAGTDCWHGPSPRPQQAHRKRPVIAGAGEGALHRLRGIMAWRAVHLPSARLVE